MGEVSNQVQPLRENFAVHRQHDQRYARCDNSAWSSSPQINVSGGPDICDIVPALGMSMRPSKESFYMNLWDNQCAPSLHSIFHRIASLQDLSPVITDTMKALAARQLSRMLPRRRTVGSSDDHASSFGPDPEQQGLSGEFSSAAMRSVSRWTWADFNRDPTTAMVALILFCHLESLTSNFPGFYLHSRAVETLVSIQGRSAEAGPLSSHGAELVAAWTQSKLHNWWRRFHFSTPAFQRDNPSLVSAPMMLPMSSVAGSSRVSVLMNLCESYRLNAADFMHCCDELMDIEARRLGDGVRTAPTDISYYSWGHSEWGSKSQEEQPERQRYALDEWHDRLPPSELPMDPNLGNAHIDGASYSPTVVQVKPLHFRSHDAAMNYAYYVTARILQCTGFLATDRLPGGSPSHSESINTHGSDAEAWVALLLRIAAGIDWKSCTRLNTYTVGLSGLLLVCVLRSDNPATGPWVEDWLCRRHHKGCLEEGGFPLAQILRILHAINQEREYGRCVRAVCQPVDDGGGAGKFQSYNSQSLPSVLVYGSCIASGSLYSRYIEL